MSSVIVFTVDEVVSVHACVWARVCVWVWVRMRTCVCMCVCVLEAKQSALSHTQQSKTNPTKDNFYSYFLSCQVMCSGQKEAYPETNSITFSVKNKHIQSPVPSRCAWNQNPILSRHASNQHPILRDDRKLGTNKIIGFVTSKEQQAQLCCESLFVRKANIFYK